MLDQHDNLPMAFKTIVDAVCFHLDETKACGQGDSTDKIKISYNQRKPGKNENPGTEIIISWTES